MSRKGIDSIFGQDPEGKYYDKKALLYQDILKFGSTLEENESFKLRDLAKHLLSKNEEIRNRYSGKKLTNTYKIENITRRVKRNIDSLVNLRLMIQTESVKEERGTGLVSTFRYTQAGYVFSNIIRCLDQGKENAQEELYRLFHDQLFKVDKDSSSFIIFACNMIRKIYEKGLFGIYLSKFQVLHSDVTDIDSFVKAM